MAVPESAQEPRRRLRWLLVVVGLCLLLPLEAAEPSREEMSATERQAKLKERNRLQSEAEKLQQAGKLVEAIAAAEKMLAIEREVLGKTHEDVVDSLQLLAELHQQREDFTAAGKRLREARDIQTARYGKDDWRVTDARLALADVELRDKLDGQQRKQLAEANRLNEEVIDLFEKGKGRAAVPLAERALALRKQVLGEKHPEYANSLNNLAELYRALGDHVKAEPLYRQALAIDKEALGQKHPGYATDLNNLAALYKLMGDHARAEPRFRQAADIRKQALGAKHLDYSQSLNNLAVLYESMGDYARAEPLFRQALAIKKQALGEKHPSYATSLNNLAALYNSMGDYVRAEPLYRQALAIKKQALGEKHPEHAASLNNLARLYKSMGDYARAEPLYRQALAIDKEALGEKHPWYAQSLNNLAVLYTEMGDHAGAESLYRQALDIKKEALGKKHPAYAESLNNLALLYWAMEDYARAEPLYRQASASWKEVLGEKHPSYATSLHNLASLCQSMGDYTRAEPLYRQSLAINKEALGEKHPNYAQSLNNLALLYQDMGDYARAEPLYRQTLDITRQSLQLTASIQSERQQLATGDKLRFQLDNYLSAVVQAQAKTKLSGDPFPALYGSVLAWKGAVFMQQRRQRLQRSHPELAASFAQLDRVTSRLAALALAIPAPKQQAAFRRQIEDLSEEKERLEAHLSQRSAAFRQQRQAERLPLDRLRASLPPGTALVDFLEYTHRRPSEKKKGKWHFEQRLAAFVVRRDSLAQLDLGPLQSISQAIDRWRSSIRRRTRPIMGENDPAVELRRRLWRPLQRHLHGARLVLISPDGALARLPLGALPGSELNKYLLEEVPLAIVPVPQLLPELLAAARADEKAEPSLLLVGDVDFGAAAGIADARGAGRAAARGSRSATLLRFTGLEATREEILAVRDSFEQRHADGRVKWLRAAAATEAAVRRLAPGHRFLHFATHGFFAPPELRSALAPVPARQKGPDLFGQQGVSGFHPGLLSGLALAGANRPTGADADDGILTALEVAEMDLSGVHLATLSACETGLGETAGGEGLLGLQRAFQVAGARSAVASLWKVPDQATKVLMERFYENLWDRKPGKLEALRQAQLWMLREAPKQPGLVRGLARGLDLSEDEQPQEGRALPPYYWAAFVLSGDWR